jgi:predicted aspartyl protease
MIRYRYNRQVDPPAPFVNMVVCHPTDPSKVEQLPALIDSGASLTTVPQRTIDQLGLAPDGDVLAGGFQHPAELVNIYSLTLVLHQWSFTGVEVIANDEDYVLLGRNVLNQFVTVLDGKRLVLELRES